MTGLLASSLRPRLLCGLSALLAAGGSVCAQGLLPPTTPARFRQLSAESAALEGVSLAQALAAPASYRGKCLQVVGLLTRIQVDSGPDGREQTCLTVDTNGRAARFETPGQPELGVGETIYLLVRMPADAGAGPLLLAWTPESAIADAVPAAGEVARVPGEPAGQGEAPVDPMGPAQVHVPQRPQTAPGEDRRRLSPPANAPRGPGNMTPLSAPAYSVWPRETFSPVYTPSSDEYYQFQSYANLARYFNPKLSAFQANLIAQCLFAYCGRFGVPRPLAASLIHAESDYDPLCKSHAGAMGLTQIMPETARGFGVTSPYDISQNIYGGMRELSEDLRNFNAYREPRGLSLALAAYNAGPNAVKRYGGIPPYAETQNYVRKVTALYRTLLERGYR